MLQSINYIGNVALPKTIQFNCFSHLLNKSYKIYIAEPIECLPNKKKYPVIYLLDANSTFSMVVEMVRMLQLTGELGPLYIVGIGYEDETLTSISNRRVQEFTPTADPRYKKIWDEKSRFTSNGGDADKFLQFIQEELKPFVNDNYPVNQDDATLIGDSLGGLFSLYTLFLCPDAFRRYVIGSPAIFWDQGILWKSEQKYAKKFRNLNAQIFIGVGELEDIKPYHFPRATRKQTSHIGLVRDMGKMVRVLKERGYPDLRIHSHIFEGETHMSVIAPLINRGLRNVFNAPLKISNASPRN